MSCDKSLKEQLAILGMFEFYQNSSFGVDRILQKKIVTTVTTFKEVGRYSKVNFFTNLLNARTNSRTDQKLDLKELLRAAKKNFLFKKCVNTGQNEW